jgi:hypothetical protein
MSKQTGSYPEQEREEASRRKTEGMAVPRLALLALQIAGGGGSPCGKDPAAERLLAEVTARVDAPLPLVQAAARRVAAVDQLVGDFRRRYPGGLVVSVGSFLGTRGQRLGGRWLDVDTPDFAAFRQEVLGRRPGYRQIAASLAEPEPWLRSLGCRGRPLLVLLEEPLLALPGPALGPLLDGIAAHLPDGTEVLAPTDRRWALGTLVQQGSNPVLVQCNHTISSWPRLLRRPLEAGLAVTFEELQQLSYLLGKQGVPTLLPLRLG